MPIKKGSEAYYALLARKRADTKIRNIKKEMAETGVGTRKYNNLQKELKSIESARAGTYQYEQVVKDGRIVNARKKEKQSDINRAIKFIESRAPSKSTISKNVQTLHELNAPFNKDTIGTGKYNELEVRAFFAATRRAWQGKPYGERIQAIMQYYNVSDLGAFVDKVLKMVRKDFSDMGMDELMKRYEEFIEQSSNDAEDNERKGSPITFAVVLNEVSQYTLKDIREFNENEMGANSTFDALMLIE